MLDDCVASELPNEVWSVAILVWRDRRMNNKADKWGRFAFWFFEE